MYRVAAALLIFMSGEAGAQEWTGVDYALLGSALTLTAIDWGQTRDIAKQPPRCSEVAPGSRCTTERFKETNPFLGPHPTTKDVDRYFGLYMASTAALSFVMPQIPRRLFLGGIAVIEARTAYKNYQLGLKVSF